MTRLVYAVTAPESAATLLRGQLRHMAENGFDVHLVCSPGEGLREVAAREYVTIHEVPMSRDVSLLADLRSLLALVRLFRELRPEITNVGTPKAGLLAGLAAWLNRVPKRIYTMRGLRAETSAGWHKKVLLLFERVSCRCAHTVICVSPSLRDLVIEEGVVSARKAIVLGKGSSNGVDTERFKPAASRPDPDAIALRATHGIAAEAPVVGFVGRLVTDKGLPELVRAHQIVRRQLPDTRLVLLGTYEDGDPLDEETIESIENDPSIVRVAWADPAKWYHAFDVVALPTRREGFPNVALEAAASGVAVVTTNATGAIDSVEDGVTGYLVPVGDADQLALRLLGPLCERQLAERIGAQGRERVLQSFSHERSWAALREIHGAATGAPIA